MKKHFSIALVFLFLTTSLTPVFADTDSEKLDQILKELQEIKAELQIVKIRATQE